MPNCRSCHKFVKKSHYPIHNNRCKPSKDQLEHHRMSQGGSERTKRIQAKAKLEREKEGRI